MRSVDGSVRPPRRPRPWCRRGWSHVAQCLAVILLGALLAATPACSSGSAERDAAALDPNRADAGAFSWEKLDAGAAWTGKDPEPDGGPADGTVPCAGAETERCLRVTAGTSSSTTSYPEGATGGAAYDDACPVGEALVGLQGTLFSEEYAIIASIEGLCGAIDVTAEAPHVTAVFDREALPVRGRAGTGSTWAQRCPRDQVVAGFVARAGQQIDALALRCATVRWTSGATDLALGASARTPFAGGSGGTPQPPAECDAGQVAVGVQGGAGDWVDAFGMRCATMRVE